MEIYGLLLAAQAHEELEGYCLEQADMAAEATLTSNDFSKRSKFEVQAAVRKISLFIAAVSLWESTTGKAVQAYTPSSTVAAEAITSTSSDSLSNTPKSVAAESFVIQAPEVEQQPSDIPHPASAVPASVSESQVNQETEPVPPESKLPEVPPESKLPEPTLTGPDRLPESAASTKQTTDVVPDQPVSSVDARDAPAAGFDRSPTAQLPVDGTAGKVLSGHPPLDAPGDEAKEAAIAKSPALPHSIKLRHISSEQKPILLAQAIAPAADGTGTQVNLHGNQFDINGGSLSSDGANLFHSFQRLGLSADQIANFMSNPNIRNILGRVVGGEASHINGLLQVTGGNSNLFLMNPAGIVFGPNARLDVAGSFTATTANGIKLGEKWFNAIGSNNYPVLVGNPQAFAFTMGQPGAIVNAGDLAVAQGQQLTLVGGTVVNTGKLSAPGGAITVTAVPGGKQVQINQEGILLGLKVEPTGSNGPNALPFTPASLPALLTGGQHNRATGVIVNSDGTVQLTASRSTIPTTPGTAIASGTLNTSGQTGGSVGVFGDRVGVIGANINASGANGGGTVLIGGDYRGQGTVPNATETTVSNDSAIRADGLTNGNGGKIIVWADQTANVHGTLTARGGAASGNGGLIETSGKRSLNVTSTPDASAPHGNSGTWLLDPTNITIVGSGGGAIGTNTVNVGNINTALNSGTNVTITTAIGGTEAGDITQNAGAAIQKTAGGDAALTLAAANNINLNASITSTSGRLNLLLTGDTDNSGAGGVYFNAPVTTNGGNITATGASNVNTSAIINFSSAPLNAGSGAITLTGAATGTSVFSRGVDINGTVSASGGISITGSSTTQQGIVLFQGINGGSGPITLTADVTSLDAGFSVPITGSGNLTIQPLTPGQNLTIGGSGGSTATFLNASELGKIQDGFSSITIGRANGSGAISLGGKVTFEDPVTLRSPVGTGSFNNQGFSLEGPFNITLQAANTITLGAGTYVLSRGDGFSFSGGAITLDGNVVTPNGTANIQTLGSNTITFTKPINANLSIRTSGTVRLEQGFIGGSLGLDAFGLQVAGSYLGNHGFGNIPVTLIGDTLFGGAGSTSITFGNTVNIANHALTVQSNTIQVRDIAGSSGSSVNLNGAVTIPGDAAIVADEINFGGTVSGTGSLTLQPATSNQSIVLGGTADSSTNVLDLTSNDLNALRNGFNSITIGRSDGSGAITLGNNVTFNNPVTLRSPNGSVNTTDGTITSPGRSVTISGATIATGRIDTSIDAIGSSTNGGAIQLLSSGGNITTGNLTTAINNGLGTAGSITLDVSGGTGNINTSAGTLNTFGVNGSGGAISLTTQGGNITTGPISSFSNTTVSNSKGGDVTLRVTAGNGSINTTGGQIDAHGNNAGAGGTIAASTVNGNITTGNLTSRSRLGNGGNITLQSTGTGSINTSNGPLDSRSSDTVSFGGNGGGITIATNNGSVATGVLTSVSNTGGTGGAITVTGGNGGTSDGIAVNGAITSGKGSITLTGTSVNGNGIQVLAPINSGGGSIQASGSSATATGILTRAAINTNGGNLTFNGTSNGTGNFARGIDINGDITSSGGNITFNGTGTSEGIVTFSPINSGGGNITFTGNSTGTGTFARGIALVNSVNSQGGAINFTGAGANAGISTFTSGTANGTISSGTGNISLTADQTLLQNTISGTGNLLLQPLSSTLGLTIGGTGDAATTFLNSTELGNLTNGFTSITIGRADGSGAINVAGSTVFNDPTILRSPTGNISLSGGAILRDNASLNFISSSQPTTVLTTDITSTAGTPLFFFGRVQLNGDITISTAAGGDDIRFNGALDGNRQLTLNAGSGTVIFGSAVGGDTPLRGLVVNSQNTQVASRIRTNGNIQLNSAVTFTNGASIDAENGGITITGTITGADSTPINLDADGNISIQDAIAAGGMRFETAAVFTGGNLTSVGAPITVVARDRITAGAISSSGEDGRGGNVSLDPQGDIQVSYINAQGGPNGVGGKVNIRTNSLFRATGSFSDRNGVIASISTAGGLGGGSITINNGGGLTRTPFIVGNAAQNGTAGAITTGQFTLSPTQSFLRSFNENNIQIISASDLDLTRNLIEPQQQQSQQQSQQEISTSTQTEIGNDTLTEVSVNSINQGNAVETVSNLEQATTTQYESYLGLPKSTVVQPEAAGNTLRRIESEIGIRPALIYISFASTAVAPETKQLGNLVTQTKSRDQLELILVNSNGETIRKTIPGATRARVMVLAEQFRDDITNPVRRKNKTPLLKPSQQLYRWLIAPLEPELKRQGIQNLSFILDAGLRSLPMAALYDAQNQAFLVEKYSIGLMPALSLTDTRYVNLKNTRVLAMGASQFPPATAQGSLPAVPLELDLVKEQWKAEALTDSKFTLSNLRQQPPFGIIHLATHASFRQGPPSNSFIQFEDTALSLAQLRSLDWRNQPPELIVLSACRTAFGNEQAELGFAGSALQARVKSVLASLWSVSDVGASALMAEFYHQLKTANIKAEAVRQAQIAMLRGKVYIKQGKLHWSGGEKELPPSLQGLDNTDLSHPYYWSAFTLVGNPW